MTTVPGTASLDLVPVAYVFPRGGHRRSLAGEVNQLVSDEADPPPPLQPSNQRSRADCHPLQSLASRVSSKLEEGDYRAALRLA